jgi:PKD repeat protein
MTDKSSDNLEKTFRKAFEGYSTEPSSKVLRKIRFQLGVSDFFSVKPRKFNIVYATLIVGGLTGIIFLSERGKHDVSAKEGLSDVVQANEEDNILIEDNQGKMQTISENKTEIDAELSMPVAKFESDFIEGCVPLKVHFFNKSSSSANVNWDFGNGEKSVVSNPVYTFLEPGIYSVKLTASNKNGDTDTYRQTIKVLPSPKAEFSIDIDKSAIAEKVVRFNNKSFGGEKYIWDFGDATKDTGFEISHSYNDFGLYNVSLIAIGSNGCMDTITHTNKFIEKNYELYFPLSFRPNPSNKNSNGYYERAGQESSVFYPTNYGADEYKLQVYAPNGIEIFSTNNIMQGWNGFVRGRIAPGGIYTYKASGIYPNGKSFSVSGKVRLIVDDYYQN